MPRLPALVLLSLAACGAEVNPGELAAQRPFVLVTLDTIPPEGAPSKLKPGTVEFAISSTFAFENLCEQHPDGLRLAIRADAAPTVAFTLGPWRAATGNRFHSTCAEEGVECPDLVHVRWDADGGRYDAALAKKSDGLPDGSVCQATYVADALKPDFAVLEGSCDNLLGSFTKGDEQPVFGPVKLSLRALCRRP